MRILTPGGVILYDETTGSGHTTNPELKTDMMYTLSKEMDYNNLKQQVCFEFAANDKLQRGSYVVVVHNTENKMGVATFALR